LDTENPPRRTGGAPRSRGRGFSRGGSNFGGSSFRGRGSNSAGGNSSRGGNPRRERRPPRTQEELDKELDAFMSEPVPAENGGAGENGTTLGEEMAID
jgi:C-terminal duplication domain of Friend of PRMT1